MTYAQILLRAALEDIPTTLNDPDPAPNARATATIKPATAAALAGHIYQHSPSAARTPLMIERIVSPWRVCLTASIGWKSRRILVGDHTDNLDDESCLVLELCGHIGCDEAAPAGPGSRCSTHYADPVPEGWPSTYWAELGATAWAQAHNETGEVGILLRNQRNGVVMGSLAAGMDKSAIHRLTGIARSTIDRILTPERASSVDDDPDYGPA